MNNLLKLIIVCFVLVSISACSNKNQAKESQKYSVKDSILLSNIRKFNKENIREGLLVLRFNKRSSDEFSFTISYILNFFDLTETELKDQQYLYIGSKPIIVIDYMNSRNVLGTKVQKIDSLFIKKVLPSLGGIGDNTAYTYEPLYWTVSYKKGQVEVQKSYVIPYEFSVKY